MAPPPDVAPSHLVGPLFRYAASRGAALEPARWGLPADVSSRQDVAIGGRELAALFDAVAEALDEPHVGLLLPAAPVWQSYALPDLAARASATLRESLQRLVRYASLLNPALVFRLDEEPPVARFAQRFTGHPRGLGRHVHELSMAMGLRECRERIGKPLVLREVRFIHARPRELAPLRDHFGTDALHFGGVENALVFDAALLDAPQSTADPRLLATVDTLAEHAVRARPAVTEGFRAIVAARLRERLGRSGEGELELRSIAVALRMSARTLQRRLGDEDTTFADVLDAVREAAARELVADASVPLGEIAYCVGYSEAATFARAFKRWTGRAPGAYRERSG